jgi:uncharacterized protein YbgA (DUF1722 family)
MGGIMKSKIREVENLLFDKRRYERQLNEMFKELSTMKESDNINTLMALINIFTHELELTNKKLDNCIKEYNKEYLDKEKVIVII